MTWTKLPPVEGRMHCLNCGSQHETLPMGAIIAVGFGSATVSRDGLGVYDEGACASEDDYWTVSRAEFVAASDPDHDWRIEYYGPLSESEYQRQGEAHWVLVRTGDGFA